MSGFGEELTLFGVLPVVYCFMAGATAMVLVSLATRPPSDETIDKFFPKISN